MSGSLKELIRSELDEIELMLESRTHILALQDENDVPVEIMDSASALIHCLYTHWERIFQRLDPRKSSGDSAASKSSAWHMELLTAMSKSMDGHRPLLDQDLLDRLKPYLAFRHRFRNASIRQSDWSKIRPLLKDLDKTASSLRTLILDRLEEGSE